MTDQETITQTTTELVSEIKALREVIQDLTSEVEALRADKREQCQKK